MSTNKEIEDALNQLAETGETRFVNTSIFSDTDILKFLYYRSLTLKSMELRYEADFLMRNVNKEAQKMDDAVNSIFEYYEVPESRVILASWYDGEKEENAFRRTDTHYILAEEKDVHAIYMFLMKEEGQLEPQNRYMYVSGRFASKDEESLPILWNAKKVCIKSIRELFLYVLDKPQLQKLGISLE
jgi:hypothetical protein